MSNPTATKTRFLIAAKAQGQWKKIGFAYLGQRVSLDAETSKFFPANTKSRDNIIKCCKWMESETIKPSYVDLAVRSLPIRVLRIKD